VIGTYRSPMLDAPGAVPAEEADLGVAAHYGDPLGEQRQLAGGRGWVDLSHRDVVRVEGADRLAWLHNLTTQRIDKLEPGTGLEALVLSPQGHVEHHLQLVDDGIATWLQVEPGAGPALTAFLDSMRFMLRVHVVDASFDWAVVWQPLREPHPDYLTRVDPQSDAVSGRQLFVPRVSLEVFAAEAGGASGALALEALRIEAGRARFGFDTDHRTIPHEVGWIGNAVVLDKGCYRGQETVARVANLGRPPRRLVRLHLDGSVRETLPPRGTPVFVGGAGVGEVTSTAYHHQLGPIALALVKYATADDAEVVVATDGVAIAATLEPIVERDDSPRPGQAARAAFGRRSLL
jgi:tRNA-modifying protein YgfZ